MKTLSDFLSFFHAEKLRNQEKLSSCNMTTIDRVVMLNLMMYSSFEWIVRDTISSDIPAEDKKLAMHMLRSDAEMWKKVVSENTSAIKAEDPAFDHDILQRSYERGVNALEKMMGEAL